MMVDTYSDSTRTQPHKKFIVIEGPIGVGKTALANKMALSLNAQLELEDPDGNPFLERFYDNPSESALPLQLYFLFQRHKQMQQLMQPDFFRPDVIADYLIDKDRLFAQVTLNNDEFTLYDQVYQHLTFQHPQPDLVIYLQAPIAVLFERVKKRGREYEKNIQLDYLEQINTAYTRFFHYYSGSPLLIVNASAIDLMNNEVHYNELMERVLSTQAGRHYFNPANV